MKVVNGIAYATAAEMASLDFAAIEGCGIDVLSLMENAGAATASLAWDLLGGKGRVVCLAGKGNNGGDGLVASRHLSNWGAMVSVLLGAPRDQLGAVAARQLKSAESSGAEVLGGDAQLGGHDLLLDALLGYNARGSPRGETADIVRSANASAVPILAVDVPSGLDPTTGAAGDPCIRARATLTLGLPKAGFLNPLSREYTGDVYLGDVSIPRVEYLRLAGAAPSFGGRRFVRIG